MLLKDFTDSPDTSQLNTVCVVTFTEESVHVIMLMIFHFIGFRLLAIHLKLYVNLGSVL